MRSQKSGGFLRRHPFACVTAIALLGLIALVEWPSAPAPAPKKLDYAKPIVTGYSAMICPQSLLFDLRANHDPDSVVAAFYAITNRSEKAEALGCELMQEGIPVKATKTGDSFVSISISGLPGSFFTMEGELENPEGAASLNSAAIGTDALAVSIESARIDFQKSFPALNKSMLNLRWFDDQIDSSDSQESASLVTPYGLCIDLVGNRSAGYSLLFVGNYYHSPHDKGTIVGTYQDRMTAIHASEDYCHKWYLAERDTPPNQARDTHIWFTPDEGDTVAPVAEVPSANISPDAADPNGVSTEGTQPPAPIERTDAERASETQTPD